MTQAPLPLWELLNQPASLEAERTKEYSLVSLTRLICSFSPMFSTVVQLPGLWQKMAACSWACHAKQVLLVSHTICMASFHCSSVLHLPLSSLSRFGLRVDAECVACVFYGWARDIDDFQVCEWLVMLLKLCSLSNPVTIRWRSISFRGRFARASSSMLHSDSFLIYGPPMSSSWTYINNHDFFIGKGRRELKCMYAY